MVPWAGLAGLGRDLWDGGRFWEIWLDHSLSYDLSWIVMNVNWFLEQGCLRSKLHLRAYWGQILVLGYLIICCVLEHIVTYDIDHKELLVINLGVGKAGRVWSDHGQGWTTWSLDDGSRCLIWLIKGCTGGKSNTNQVQWDMVPWLIRKYEDSSVLSHVGWLVDWLRIWWALLVHELDLVS